MPQRNRTCLIIAQSGRALAASAVAGGWGAHVLDRFIDLDTFSIALSCQRVSGGDNGFHADMLREKLAPLLAAELYGVVYGSGLEDQYETLEFLKQHWALVGNDVAVVSACKEPALFFPVLSKLGIPHPQISLTVPHGADWLVKKTGAAGGGHIQALNAEVPPAGPYYFQKKLAGRSLSVVFLADSRDATIAGINEIWTVAPEKNDFRYAGAITGADLPVSMTQTLEDIVRVLVRETGLLGLCGMDVLLDENGQCYVLEINPRPTATFELYESGPPGLFDAHIQACAGRLRSLPKHSDTLRAHQILYAEDDFITPAITWPEWVRDRPSTGRLIRAGEPVCTVHAEAPCRRGILALLKKRTEILQQLTGLKQLAA